MDEAERRACLAAMGIELWLPRAAPAATTADAVGPAPAPVPGAGERGAGPPVPSSAPEGAEAADWTALGAAVAACTRCELHRGRTQTVFGVGRRDADWLLVGEAPGAEEDRRGEPFVGRAGQLLNEMLRAIGLARERVYIANILKCRPPANRDPRPDEALACEPYLLRQVELLRPRVILALGRIAAHNLLKVDTPLARLRGRQHAFGAKEIPLVVTYHPAYLLRSPHEKRKAWQDLIMARRIAQGDA